MADTRTCARCGRTFEPKREHARFCSARCRVAWNRDNVNPDRWGAVNWAPERQHDPQTQASALSWAMIGMRDTTARLGRVRATDRPQAFAVIGEAVWWVTIVDATLVRYHPQVYEAALAALPDHERQLTEGTFGGLRFVRNRMGYYADHTDFIQPLRNPECAADAPISEWTWKSIAPPALDSLPPRGREWEMARYRAYQAWLAGQPVGDTFNRAAGFLTVADSSAGTPVIDRLPTCSPSRLRAFIVVSPRRLVASSPSRLPRRLVGARPLVGLRQHGPSSAVSACVIGHARRSKYDISGNRRADSFRACIASYAVLCNDLHRAARTRMPSRGSRYVHRLAQTVTKAGHAGAAL